MSICERPMDRWWPFSADGPPSRSASARPSRPQPSVSHPMRCEWSRSMTSRDGWRRGLSLALLWIATFIHCRGVGTGGRMQLLLRRHKSRRHRRIDSRRTLDSGQGTGTISSPGPPSQQSTLGAAAIALVIVTYCYLGWNVAGYIASDIADPQRTLPKIMIGGTAFVAVIYLLLNVVYLSALSIPELAQEPIIPVAEKAAAALWGPQSGRLVAAILCLSIAGAVSAMTWAGPRVYWAMARDGMISPWLARLHPRNGVPARAIVFQSLWASLLILSGTFEQLLVYSGLVLSLFMALTLSTIFRLRRAGAVSPPTIPRSTLSLLTRGPRHRSLHIGHLQSRPTTYRIVVWSGDCAGGIPLYYFFGKERN